jgi:hypothetical protein
MDDSSASYMVKKSPNDFLVLSGSEQPEKSANALSTPKTLKAENFLFTILCDRWDCKHMPGAY